MDQEPKPHEFPHLLTKMAEILSSNDAINASHSYDPEFAYIPKVIPDDDHTPDLTGVVSETIEPLVEEAIEAPKPSELQGDIVKELWTNKNLFFTYQPYLADFLRNGSIPTQDHENLVKLLVNHKSFEGLSELLDQGLLEVDKGALLTHIFRSGESVIHAFILSDMLDAYSEKELVTVVTNEEMFYVAVEQLAAKLSAHGQEELLKIILGWRHRQHSLNSLLTNFDKLSGTRMLQLYVDTGIKTIQYFAMADFTAKKLVTWQEAYDIYHDNGLVTTLWAFRASLKQNDVVYDEYELATEAIQREGGIESVISSLYDLAPQTGLRIVNELIERIGIDGLAQNLVHFYDGELGTRNELIFKLIEHGHVKQLYDNIAAFKNVSREALEAVIDAYNAYQHEKDDEYETEYTLEFGDGTDPKAFDASFMFKVLARLDTDPDTLLVIFKAAIPMYRDDISVAHTAVNRLDEVQISGPALLELMKTLTIDSELADKLENSNEINARLTKQEQTAYRAYVQSLNFPLEGVRTDHTAADTAGSIEFVTSSRPGTEFHKLAVEVNRELRNENGEYKEVLVELKGQFHELSKSVAEAFGADYADKLFGESHSKNDLWPIYRRLMADCIAGLAIENDVDPNNIPDLKAYVKRAAYTGNLRFMQVLTTDVPLYDKLYSEWDAKRVGQREFEEVFLGRDGIYAYVGRRAQLHARQQRLGVRKGDAQEDDSQLAMPTYLVYPTLFREGFSNTTKRAYIEQRVRNPEAAYYFDTGFVGSIPEDILNVSGVPQSDRDRRIRLLSATKRVRTVAGVENAQREGHGAVGRIEDNEKDEHTAEGIMMDENGRLEHYAKPTKPDIRFAFRMTELALHRHYYQKEMSSESSSTYTTADLGHDRELRVNPAFDTQDRQMLTELFSADRVGTTLKNASTELRVAQPEDAYPDQLVFSVPLPSGEAIVKPVLQIKGEGILDEFEALVLMDSLNIDVPKPIARVFMGKEGGFTVMESVPGINGRVLDEYFDRNQVSADDKGEILERIREAMVLVAHRTRQEAGIDKPWRLSDFMIDIKRAEDGTLDSVAVTPVHFSGAQVFNREKPQPITMGDAYERILKDLFESRRAAAIAEAREAYANRSDTALNEWQLDYEDEEEEEPEEA